MTGEIPSHVHLVNPTHYANLMMRYLVLRRLRMSLPNILFSNVKLPWWNIDYPPVSPDGCNLKVYRVIEENNFPFQTVSYLSESGMVGRIEWVGYGQRMENFPPLEMARLLLPQLSVKCYEPVEGDIVCPVRAAEILDAIHPGYTILPPRFYEFILRHAGGQLVFMGQTSDNSYVSRLRAMFPNARFIAPQGALADFETIRRASRVVVSVSTFAWLAAWLSGARNIYLPIQGLFDRRLFPTHDLIPICDPRYHFFLFPKVTSVPLAELDAQHAQIDGSWRFIKKEELLNLFFNIRIN